MVRNTSELAEECEFIHKVAVAQRALGGGDGLPCCMLVIPRLELHAGVLKRHASADALGSADPITAARAWAAEGYSRLQLKLVDQDAPSRRGSSQSLVENLVRDVGIEIDIAAGADSTPSGSRAGSISARSRASAWMSPAISNMATA